MSPTPFNFTIPGKEQLASRLQLLVCELNSHMQARLESLCAQARAKDEHGVSMPDVLESVMEGVETTTQLIVVLGMITNLKMTDSYISRRDGWHKDDRLRGGVLKNVLL